MITVLLVVSVDIVACSVRQQPDFCLCICLKQSGQFSEDMIPTVGFNMRKVTKGNVTIKVRQQATFQLYLLAVLLKLIFCWPSACLAQYILHL